MAGGTRATIVKMHKFAQLDGTLNETADEHIVSELQLTPPLAASSVSLCSTHRD